MHAAELQGKQGGRISLQSGLPACQKCNCRAVSAQCTCSMLHFAHDRGQAPNTRGCSHRHLTRVRASSKYSHYSNVSHGPFMHQAAGFFHIFEFCHPGLCWYGPEPEHEGSCSHGKCGTGGGDGNTVNTTATSSPPPPTAPPDPQRSGGSDGDTGPPSVVWRLLEVVVLMTLVWIVQWLRPDLDLEPFLSIMAFLPLLSVQLMRLAPKVYWGWAFALACQNLHLFEFETSCLEWKGLRQSSYKRPKRERRRWRRKSIEEVHPLSVLATLLEVLLARLKDLATRIADRVSRQVSKAAAGVDDGRNSRLWPHADLQMERLRRRR